jgi:integrase
MPKRSRKLSVKQLENLRPAAARREVPDGACPGLYYILQPSGSATWALRYRDASGRQHKLQLGSANLSAGEHDPQERGLSLAGARLAATRERQRIGHGANPAAERAAMAGDTVARLAGEFIEQHAAKRRPETARQYRQILTKEVLPKWGNRSVHGIRPRDISELVAPIATDRPVRANRTHAVLGVFFSWLVGIRHILQNNPCAGTKRPAEETSRDRVLDDDELRRVWEAADKCSPLVRGFVQLLILTAQRRSEVAGMQRSELDLEGATWTLPAVRRKNKRPLVVPLSKRALDVINSLPRFDGDFVFGYRKPLTAFHPAKAEVDAWIEPPAFKTPWKLHDLRRTTASGMARIGIPPHIIEATIGHQSGKIAGIAAIYNRYDFAREKKSALDRWAAHIADLVGGSPGGRRRTGKVVNIRERRRSAA